MKQCLMLKIILCLAIIAIPLAACAASSGSSSSAAAKTVERPVDLQFNGVQLGDALDALFKGTGKSFTLDPGLQQFRIIAVLKNVSFDEAVGQVLRSVGAIYSVDKAGVYHIGFAQQTPQQFQYANQMPPAAMPAPGSVVAAPPMAQDRLAANAGPPTSEVVQIKNQSPAVIGQFIAQNNPDVQVSVANGNTVILQGENGNVMNAAKIAKSLDEPSNLPRAIRLKMSAKVTVATTRGPKTYDASTESVGAEQMPSLLNLDAQTTTLNYNMANRNARQLQTSPTQHISLVNATVTPSFIADKIAVVGRGHFSCPVGSVPGTELSKDFDIAASLTPGKPFSVAAGSVNMVFGSVDFDVLITATPEQGRIPYMQNGYNYNNPAPSANPNNGAK